jgi:hypothetical protein
MADAPRGASGARGDALVAWAAAAIVVAPVLQTAWLTGVATRLARPRNRLWIGAGRRRRRAQEPEKLIPSLAAPLAGLAAVVTGAVVTCAARVARCTVRVAGAGRAAAATCAVAPGTALLEVAPAGAALAAQAKGSVGAGIARAAWAVESSASPAGAADASQAGAVALAVAARTSQIAAADALLDRVAPQAAVAPAAAADLALFAAALADGLRRLRQAHIAAATVAEGAAADGTALLPGTAATQTPPVVGVTGRAGSQLVDTR